MLIWYGIFFVVCTVGGIVMAVFVSQPKTSTKVYWEVFNIMTVVTALVALFKNLAMLRAGV